MWRFYSDTPQDCASQTPGIAIAHVVDPALDAGVEFSKGDTAGGVEFDVGTKPAREANLLYLAPLSRPRVGENKVIDITLDPS